MSLLRFGIALLILTVTAGGCGNDSPASPSPANQLTFLSFTSEFGEYVGGGQTVFITPQSAAITAAVGCSDGQIEVRVRGAGNTWTLHMTAPRSARLTPGTYDGATRWPFQIATQPGLDFSGNARGCGELSGHFVVKEALYAPDGTAERFHATFEQRCANKTEALRGEIKLPRATAHSEPFLVCP